MLRFVHAGDTVHDWIEYNVKITFVGVFLITKQLIRKVL